ncbi:DUF6090 family protein [Ekhidna sp.]|uniref:DUF6090 family protein n=1 Tax=Ekhidna sp. TaxID=2608089 RepID=UPI003B5137C9
MKKILTTLSQKWPEYLLEILVITIGILGAFGLNRWNEQVRFENEQAQIIANLNEEFTTNVESLNSQIARLERKIRACSQIMSYIHASKPLPDTILVDTLVNRIYDNPTWNPSTFVLTDLRNSGQLKALKNQQLKALLHQWEQHYENLREWYQLETSMFNRTMDFLTENGSARNTLFSSRFGRSTFPQNNEMLFQSIEFENLVAHNLMLTSGLYNIYQSQTLELISEILEETKTE